MGNGSIIPSNDIEECKKKSSSHLFELIWILKKGCPKIRIYQTLNQKKKSIKKDFHFENNQGIENYKKKMLDNP